MRKSDFKSTSLPQRQLPSHGQAFQGNEISRAMYGCSLLARKLIAFGALKLSEENLSESHQKQVDYDDASVPMPNIRFKISETLKALGLAKAGTNYVLIKNAVRELRTCGIVLKDDENEYFAYNWFQSIHYDKTRDLIEMQFTQAVGAALHAWKNGFSKIDLKTMGDFKSFYAFRFYEIAVSWMGNKGKYGNKPGTWWFRMSIDEIRKTFQIAETAYAGRPENFISRVIKLPCDELNAVCPDFTIVPAKLKKGRKTIGFIFECTEKAKQYKIASTMATPEKKEREKLNKEQLTIERIKGRYAEEYGDMVEDFRLANNHEPTLLDEFSLLAVLCHNNLQDSDCVEYLMMYNPLR